MGPVTGVILQNKPTIPLLIFITCFICITVIVGFLSWLLTRSSQRHQRFDAIKNSARAIPFSTQAYSGTPRDDPLSDSGGIHIVSANCSDGYLSIVVGANQTVGQWSEEDIAGLATYIESIPSAFLEVIDNNGHDRPLTSVREYATRAAKDGVMINFGGKHTWRICNANRDAIAVYSIINIIAGDCQSAKYIRFVPTSVRSSGDILSSEFAKLDYEWCFLVRDSNE